MSAPLEVIPEHLREYITEQYSHLYTPIDQAVWRYVMRVSKAFFSKHGHPLYVQGIAATGMSIERIPLVEEMDRALRKLGWRAVAINGFIPPAIFLEFQSLKILAIACDIRKLDNLGYTPSPDIIHEAAGHAPIVADAGYRAYLEAYGEVARNALITKYDVELYDAILKLSELKEDPATSKEQVALAQAKFEAIAAREAKPSEAALLTRMAWWTTEYGLIEKDGAPVIYGAGLLSSVSESFNCLKDSVKKIPFSLKATIETSYDITRPQPQLFVAKSFQELTTALDQFADTMAFRKGGLYGLKAAEDAENTVTVVFENGIQVSGIIEKVENTIDGEESFFTLTGAKQFAFHDEATNSLVSHQLPTKILIPLFDKSIVACSETDLIRKLHGSGLHTKSGHRITGRFKRELAIGTHGKILLLEQVKVFDPEGALVYEERFKVYPLIIASKVISVFGGAADRKHFILKNQARIKKVSAHKSNLTPANARLNEIYQRVRDFREQNSISILTLEQIFTDFELTPNEDWLLRLEFLELYEKVNPAHVTIAKLRTQLKNLSDKHAEWKDMIVRGLSLSNSSNSSSSSSTAGAST
jgi:phenylalanine-4-hydroxylase